MILHPATENLDPGSVAILDHIGFTYTPYVNAVAVAGISESAASLALVQLQRLGYIKVMRLGDRVLVVKR